MATKRDKEAAVSSYLKELAAQERDRLSNKENRKVVAQVINQNLVLEDLERVIKRVFEKPIVINNTKITRSKGKTKRVANLFFSDPHYGALLDGKATPLPYGRTEQARRTAAIFLQLADFKRQYRADTEAYIHLGGDIIKGIIHGGAQELWAHQNCAALWYLVQAIAFAAQEFPNGVTVRAIPGNHDRNPYKDPKPAVEEKWDSFATFIFYALKVSLMQFPNVKVIIPYTPYYEYELWGQSAIFMHGDDGIKSGSPSQNINVAKIRKDLNEWSVGSDKNYDLYGVGHCHTGSITHLSNGTIFMTNGTIMPPDGYCTSHAYRKTRCGQWIWESTPGYIVGDHRFCMVDRAVDEDSELDKIIKVYDGFDS